MLEYVVITVIALFVLINIIRAVGSRMIVVSRFALMRKLESARNSRLITLIHRQRGSGMLAMFFSKYINIEDSFSILEAIRKTPEDKDIDFVVHTPGGLVLAASQIGRALANHKGHVRVIVPHYAMSGGTYLALAADEIVMDTNAVLGPVDPQIGKYPAASLLRLKQLKSADEIDDETHILIDVSEKALRQMFENLSALLEKKGRSPEEAARLADLFVKGHWTHDHPLNYEFFVENDFNVNTNVPDEVFQIMKMVPNIADAMPSVEIAPPAKKLPEAANENVRIW